MKQDFDDPLLNHGNLHCKLSVDKKVVFIGTQTWLEKGHSTLALATIQPEMEPEMLDGGPDFQYSQKGAVLRVDCPNPKKKESDLFALTRIPGPQEPDVSDVKAFTKNYSKGVAASRQCSR